MSSRENFGDAQKRSAMHENAQWVARRWPFDFQGKPPHYMCEECKFVCDLEKFFEVDHVVPCARGGTRIALNMSVLCHGCNQAKTARQFVPPGAGYAYRHHEWDRNPDHLYHGAPTVTAREKAEHPEPYDPRRYEP
jgi:hypothetical protein